MSLFLILAFSSSILASASTDSRRFMRILKAYDDPTYRVSDRDVLANGSYTGDSEDDNPDTSGLTSNFDRVEHSNRHVDGQVGGQIVEMRSDPLRSLNWIGTLHIGGTYNDSTHVRSNTLIDKGDTVASTSNQGDGSFFGKLEYSRFRERKKKGRWWYTTAVVEGMIDGYRQHSRSVHNKQLSGGDFNRTDDVRINIQGTVRPRAQIGFGRLVPVTPVYKAFEVERVLLESGVLHDTLNDSIMLCIARWIARTPSFRTAYDRPDKHIFAALDTLLDKKDTVQGAGFTPWAVMKVREVLDRDLPILYRGFRIGTSMDIRISLNYVDISDRITNDRGDGFDLAQYNSFGGLYASWQAPISRHLFYSISCNTVPLVSLDEGVNISNPTNSRWYWGASMHALITDRLFAEVSFGNLPCVVLVPSYWPGYMRIGIEWFVEDHIWVDASFMKSTNRFSSYRYSEDRSTQIEKISDRFQVGVRYDF